MTKGIKGSDVRTTAWASDRSHELQAHAYEWICKSRVSTCPCVVLMGLRLHLKRFLASTCSTHSCFGEPPSCYFLWQQYFRPDCAHENCIKIVFSVHFSVLLSVKLSLDVELELTQPSPQQRQPSASGQLQHQGLEAASQSTGCAFISLCGHCKVWCMDYSFFSCFYTKVTVLPITPCSSPRLRFKHLPTILCFHFMFSVYFWWLVTMKGHTTWGHHCIKSGWETFCIGNITVLNKDFTKIKPVFICLKLLFIALETVFFLKSPLSKKLYLAPKWDTFSVPFLRKKKTSRPKKFTSLNWCVHTYLPLNSHV